MNCPESSIQCQKGSCYRMTVKQGNEICRNTLTALATLKMIMDMLEMEYDHETEELVLGWKRVNLYCAVIESVCRQIEEIEETVHKAAKSG